MATEYECGFNAGRADYLDGFGYIPEYWGERTDDWKRGYDVGQQTAKNEENSK